MAKLTQASLGAISLTFALALAWPVIHLFVAFVRFGQLPPGGLLDSAVFLPMGLMSAVVLVVLIQKAATPGRRVTTIAGYLVASPVGFLGSLMSGLLLPPLLGTLVGGALPLILGTILGYALYSPDKH